MCFKNGSKVRRVSSGAWGLLSLPINVGNYYYESLNNELQKDRDNSLTTFISPNPRIRPGIWEGRRNRMCNSDTTLPSWGTQTMTGKKRKKWHLVGQIQKDWLKTLALERDLEGQVDFSRKRGVNKACFRKAWEYSGNRRWFPLARAQGTYKRAAGARARRCLDQAGKDVSTPSSTGLDGAAGRPR